MTQKPNIILITLDAGRADHFGFMDYRKNTSPFLDSLAKRGMYFTNAFSTGAGSPQSFVAIMTSTYPADYGGFANIEPPRVLVSEAFQKAGYKTVGIHSAAYMSGYFGYDCGWDEFRYLSPFAGGGTMAGIRRDSLQAKILRGISRARASVKNIFVINWVFAVLEKCVLLIRKIAKDTAHYTPPFFTGEEINAEVKKILPAKLDTPLFLWVHYMDAHEPFGLFLRTRGFLQKLRFYLADVLLFLFGEWPAVNRIFKSFYVNLYDASLRYADQCIGELFRDLEAKGIINDESIVAFTSDHGEEFFEDGHFGHDQRPGRVHFHVPLVFFGKTLSAQPQKQDRPVSLIDLPSTLLTLVGVPKPEVFRGGDIFDGKERDVVSQIIDCEGDLTNQKFLGARLVRGKYAFVEFERGEKLFALDDTGERYNLMESRKEIADELRRRLSKYKSLKAKS